MALSDNHKRVVWSTITLIERRANEILALLNGIPESSTYGVENDLSAEEAAQTITLVQQVKQTIEDLCDRYELKKEVMPLTRVIKTSQAFMWENLLDTDTKRLQNYGPFANEEDAAELQADLEHLLSLTEKLLQNG
ncbi:MAG: hypothetical protein EPO28_09180 [Saprospiraceae bacterium]|nr:MAG: hypothetical protein EPO28_09180 [Saprospiraceae bacterium]